jgi:hypothetical protein
MDAMHPKRLTTKFAAGALSLALGAAALTLPAPARAADDSAPLDSRILDGILKGIGLKRGDEPGINYQERAPLVIPPNRDLPPPEKVDAAVTNNPAWPNDPDIARRRAEAERERHRNVQAEVDREQNPLRPDELAPGAKYEKPVRQQAATRPAADSPDITGRYRLTPKELGTKDLFSRMFSHGEDHEVGRFTGEPQRTELTQPPPGYQVPSPDQPYGLGKETVKPKATDYLGTKGMIDSDTH